ncbi:MAG: Ca-activated chloride channel [Thermoleophilaceae bacterium]|jgi:Ca-activated chloride channel family protein|nr:Ca-activated chloride channel [Thermoleophilaceae bacterium]
MSFGEPAVLIALVALPVLALLYGRAEGRRRATAAAFARPGLRPSYAPRRPRWRRHVPMAVFALALAVLIIAVARPERTVAVPIERASIMLVTDVSGSMQAIDVPPNRLNAVKRAANRFVDAVPSPVNVGLLAFNGTPRVLQSPTRDRDAVHLAIERMRSSGGTATGEAIATAVKVLERVPGDGGRRPPGAIVLISDGKSTSGRDPVAAAQAAGRDKIPVYTVALGTPSGTITVKRKGGGSVRRPVPPDPAALAQVARVSGGRTFSADTASGLGEVYQRLGSQLSHRHEKRQITSAFAGGGLVLLMAGAAMSLVWLGRPI